MKTAEQLSIDVLNYLYDTRPYDMQDAYDTRDFPAFGVYPFFPPRECL